MTGIELIAQERAEQIEKHGFSIEGDIKYNRFNQLIEGAMILMRSNPKMKDIPIRWEKEVWKKMINKPRKERLVIAGALIAAEIDRENNYVKLEEKK